VCNGIEKINRISQTLAWDAKTGNFTTGLLLTGGTSGATATILEKSGDTATGTLTLGNISGTFLDNEVITDSSTGSATVNGTLGYTVTVVTNSPICGGIKFIGARCLAFRLLTDQTAIQYSEVDSGTNPPFTTWSNTTASADGGKVNFRNAGAVRSVAQLGESTVAFSDKGFFAFRIDTIDSNGTLKKIEPIQNYSEDYGGARGAIETPNGIYYVNEAGLWLMVTVGNNTNPQSRQQTLTSELLGSEYFKGVDQSNVDIVYDINQKIVLVTCAKDSVFNNLVVGCKPELKNAMFEFKNWNLNRFAKIGQTLYGASSTKTTAYELFSLYDDEGLEISTEYYQEIPLKALYNAHDPAALNSSRVNGIFSTPTILLVSSHLATDPR
jgi:hypothetical protein